MRHFLVAVLLCSGCDQLFPELSTVGSTPTDSSVAADAGTTILTGSVCQLADLRSPASCTTAAPGKHITIEETGATADAASDGTFSISLASVGNGITIVVSDPSGTEVSTPTVSLLTGAVLTAAREKGALLPIVSTSTLTNVELDNGVSDDATHGAVLAWIVSSTGASVAGASATRITSAVGPLYDTNDGAQLEQNTRSGTYGTVAFFELAVGESTISVAAPSGDGLAGDTFTLPVRGAAITVAALSLPSSS